MPLPLGHSVHSFCFEALSQLNVSEPELIFKYHGQWQEGILAAKRHVCLSLLLLVFLSAERHLCLSLLLSWLTVDTSLCKLSLQRVFVALPRSTKIAFSFLELAEQPDTRWTRRWAACLC